MKFKTPTGIKNGPTPATTKRVKTLTLKRSIRPTKSLEGTRSIKRPKLVEVVRN